MHALANSLGKAEKDLLREAEPKRMARLDEDELIDLHKRIRRARNKYAGIYRRQGSAKVRKKGGRGLAKEKNSRNAGRAEVFEDALARVSAQLAEVAAAKRRAAQGRPARRPQPARDLARRTGRGPVRRRPASPAQVTDRTPKGPGREKRNASSHAQGARRQAKRDNR